MPEISVVIPAYNVDKVLCKKAVDSILNQTFRDFEVLVVDDTATDESGFYKSFKDDRLKYIRNNSRLGLAESRNKGMALAQGRYIAFMDTDDYSYPHRLQKQYDFMEQHPEVDILGAQFRQHDKIIHHPLSNADIKFYLLMSGSAIGMPTAFVRKASMDRLSARFPDTIIEDYDFWLSLVKKATFANHPEVLVDYEIHPNSLSAVKGQAAIRQATVASRSRCQKECCGVVFDWKERSSFSISDWGLYRKQVNELEKNYQQFCGEKEKQWFEKTFRYIVRHTVREKGFRRALLKADLPLCFKIEQFFKEQKK